MAAELSPAATATPARNARLRRMAESIAALPPARIFWPVLAAHVLIWTVLPPLLEHNLPLDVIEQLAWGREWQIVYFKHPPLPAWVLESVAVLFHRWPPAIFAVGPLASALAMIAIWRLGRSVLGERRALIAVLAQEGVVYFTIFTPEFNHNVVLLPIWSALGLAGYRACFAPGGGWTSNARWGWVGVLAALGMLGKYVTPLLLLPMLLVSAVHPRLRHVWSGIGPWLALAVAAVLLTPHVIGLVEIHFTPLWFPFQRAPGPSHWWDHVTDPLHFALAQFGDVAAALVAITLLFWRRRQEPAMGGTAPPVLPDAQRAYLAAITWGPVTLALLASAIGGLHLKDMWGYPMWCFLGVFLMAELPFSFSRQGFLRFLAAVAVIMTVTAFIFVLQQTLGPWVTHKPSRGQFPGPELARVMDQRWHAIEGERPLAMVAGDVWIAGSIAFYGDERPSVFIDADRLKSPWITPEKLARTGAMLIWMDSHDPDWLAEFPTAERQPPVTLPYVPPRGRPPARFDWAIVPPSR